MKPKKSTQQIIWFAVCGLCVLAIVASMFVPESDGKTATPATTVTQTASASGTNTTAINQSAAATGSNTTAINQNSGRDSHLTINQGPTIEEFKALLKSPSVTTLADLSAKYDYGFLLLGMPRGQFVYEPHIPPGFKATGLDKATVGVANGAVYFNCVNFGFTRPGSVGDANWVSFSVPFDTNRYWVKHMSLMLRVNTYFEVFDKEKQVFVLGFEGPRPAPK